MYTLNKVTVVDELQALRFFFENLRDVTEGSNPDRNELLYNATVLAHFATTSTTSTETFPRSPSGLTAFFDTFVLDRSMHDDPEILEVAGSQCLVLTGFFGKQLRHRHNLNWYSKLGAWYYEQSARYSRKPNHVAMMETMSDRFGFWQSQHGRLAFELHRQAQEGLLLY